MTRDIDWGIPVPLDGWRDQPTKRLYVWFDAVIGYLSASVEWARRLGEPDRWREWWNDPEALSYYFMGKDNITFHSQIWPAELLGYAGRGDEGGEPGAFGVLNLPTEVVSSEYLTMEGKQFSTSRGYVIYIRDVLDRYGPDAIRYFICAAGPENQDANFTWAEFVQRNNSELVAGWGNLVNRTAAMVAKNFGEIPQPGPLEPVDEAVRAARCSRPSTRWVACSAGSGSRPPSPRRCAPSARSTSTSRDTEPFKLKGDDQRERLATVLHTLTQCVSDLNTHPRAVPAALVQRGARGARRRGRPSCRCRGSRTSTGLDDGDADRAYPVITGEYSTTPRWESRPVRRRARRREAHAGLHQARRVRRRRGARRSRGRGPRDRDGVAAGSGGRQRAGRPRPAADPGRRQPHPPRHRARRRGRRTDVAAASPRPRRSGSTGSSRSAATCRARGSPSRSSTAHPAVLGGVALHPNEVPGLAAARRARRGIRRDRASSPRTRGCASSARPGSTTTAPARRAFRRNRTRSAGTSTWPSAPARPCRSTTATPTTTCCASSREEGAPEQTVLHCFSGDVAMARECVDRGYLPVVRRDGDLQERQGAARRPRRSTPLDRVLVETDAPYLTPRPWRGATNAPYLVPLTVRAMAGVLGVAVPDPVPGPERQRRSGVYGPW